jgi:hypothetical protein
MDDFIKKWLKVEYPYRYTKFQHDTFQQTPIDQNELLGSLGELIFEYHNDPKEFKSNLRFLGFPELAEDIDQRPKNLKTRKGNLGEILACEYVRCFKGFDSLVFRLRYNPNPNTSMKGDDVLAFKLGDSFGNGREIVVGEAKVRKQFASIVIEEAYQKLNNVDRPKAKSIMFVHNLLRDQGRSDEANEVLSFVNRFSVNQPVQHHIVFLVTENSPRDRFRYLENQSTLVANLVAANLVIENLDNFVNSLFDYEVS